MFIYTLVIMALLSTGEVVGEVHHFDDPLDCKIASIPLIIEYSAKSEKETVVAACIQGFEV